ncbi:hypothetical protein J6590_022836 [Homalodisca vitripennis]|nr:hypothetical protein J6590_022836 [Homalodisca vitripennis]
MHSTLYCATRSDTVLLDGEGLTICNKVKILAVVLERDFTFSDHVHPHFATSWSGGRGIGRAGEGVMEVVKGGGVGRDDRGRGRRGRVREWKWERL